MRWPSGLRRTLGKRVNGKLFRGFESLPHRNYFYVKDGKITASGDYFDATGMVMALAPDQEMGK